MLLRRMLPAKSIAASSAYLLFEDQPAMKTAGVLMPPTAIRKSTPTFRSASVIFSPKGITANTTSVGMKMITGAAQKRSLSALRVVIASLSTSLRASATGCSRPAGPTRFGATPFCISATTRRSIQMKASTLPTVQSRMATTPIEDETTYGTQSGAPQSRIWSCSAPTALPISRRSYQWASRRMGVIAGTPNDCIWKWAIGNAGEDRHRIADCPLPIALASPVHLAHHDVHAAQNDDGVRQRGADSHQLQ